MKDELFLQEEIRIFFRFGKEEDFYWGNLDIEDENLQFDAESGSLKEMIADLVSQFQDYIETEKNELKETELYSYNKALQSFHDLLNAMK